MHINALDIAIVLGALLAALGGYRMGFVARVTSWIGLALGLGLAARFLPGLVTRFASSNPSTRLLLAAVLLVIGAFLGQAVGLVAGAQLHRVLPVGPVRSVDRVIGSAVGALGVIVAMWLLLPSMANVRGRVAAEARGSEVARFIAGNFPQAPDTLQALTRLVGKDNFPKVFEALRPAPDVGNPPAESGLDPTVVARVKQSTVRVEGQACDRVQDGSGFAVADDLIVTNAHVVAGEKSISVFRPDGAQLHAVPVAFDSDRDLALLQVNGLAQAPLPLGSGKVGEHGAVFGHPGGVDAVVVAPASISQLVSARGRDLYDQHSITRDVYILAAALQQGDSGGPLVNAGGTVVGVAFAIAPDQPGTSYALTSGELRSVLDKRHTTAVDTGPCLSDG